MTTPITLFDLPEPLFPNEGATDWRPEQLKTMHRDYGLQADKKCGGCAHCVARPWNKKTYYKCTKYGRFSNGSGTDWRKRWPACGAWTEQQGGA
jgi:hypothetical protein